MSRHDECLFCGLSLKERQDRNDGLDDHYLTAVRRTPVCPDLMTSSACGDGPVFDADRLAQKMHRLALCEAGRLVLYPGHVYVFEVDEKCRRCVELAADSKEA